MAVSPARPPLRVRRFGAVCLCVALAALVGVGLAGGTAAAQSAATIENVAIDDDEGLAGVTDTHRVTVETANTAGTDATVELDFTGWPADRTENIDVVTGRTVEGPTDDGVQLKPEGGTVVVDIRVTHPTTAGDVPIEAALIGDSGGRLGSESASITVESVDFEPSLGSTKIDAFGAEADHTTELTGLDNALPSDVVVISSPDLTDDELFEILDGDERETVYRRGGEIRLEPPATQSETPIELSFRDFDAASYRFDLYPERFSEDCSELPPNDRCPRLELDVIEPDVEGSFDTDRHEVSAGDMVTVDMSISGVDGGYLLVGADHKAREGRPTNLFDIVYVEGGTLTINTRLLGTSADTEDVYMTDGTVRSYLHDPPTGETEGGGEKRLSEVRFRGEDGRRTWESLTTFREEMGMGPLPWPVQAERYRFVLGADGTVELREDGIADFAHPIARSNLQMTEPGVESVETYVAPRGPANEFETPGDIGSLTDGMTQRETVAKEDRLVFEVNATGIYGALHHLAGEEPDTFEEGIHPEVFQSLLGLTDEGIVLEALQTDMTSNEPRTELDLGGATDGEAYVLPDIDENNERVVDGRFYLVVDTRDAGAFENAFSDGESDDFEFEYGYESPPEERYRFGNDALSTRPEPFDPESEPTEDGTEHYPYLNRAETGTTETVPFTVAESYAEYDRTTNQGQVALSNGTNVTLTGETNVAPASEFYIQIVADDRSNPTRITIDDVDVDENGTFEATKDLSVLRVGEGVEVEFYAEDRIVDKRGGVVSGDRGTPSRFVIREAPDRVTAGTADRVTVGAVIENTGAATESKPVDLRIGGADVDSVRRTLAGGANRSVELDAGTLEEGTYRYVLSTPDDEAVGELAVGRAAPVGVVDTERDDGDEGGEDGTDDGDEGGQDGTDDGDEGGQDGTDGDNSDDPGLPTDDVLGMLGALGALSGAVGAEHAVGGAAVVGGIHVLGYWV
ncbi:BGTF surface domain-containing protein [Natronomonas sp. LN261]|uniref:BGTF surface domain-containing protein n=1 Tax=Natronomonas sp. LN261 TaxID=2750669 RepID=UPI0015EE3951|nr:BGTF surface domain-containing protein [Natronomonas sp. LN261]